jgi:hypothetical protein
MALVATTMRVRLLWIDNDGAESSSMINIPAATGLDSALSFLASWRQLAMAISSATCYGADLIVRYGENENFSASDGSDVLRNGVLIFGADPDGLAAVHVPSIDVALILTSGAYAGIALDLAAPALAAFIAALASGIAGVAACDPLAADLGDLTTAYMQQL